MNSARTYLGRRGFTLIEIMIVLIIIGLLASMAMAAVNQAREIAQNNRLVNDFRHISHAFQRFSLETGQFPEDAASGVIPVDMTEYLRSMAFTGTTFIGGSWDWDKDTFGITAGVSLVQSNANVGQMGDVDGMLDDGDLTAGLFQRLGANRYTLIIEF